ncbi:MAG: FMN-binding negative transcriptional regulator [Planctomycetales bacterium]|nr:FMN-binding negative transcriptional regulator [Planctomycetales bacterium]
MYVPTSFAETDVAKLHEFIEQNSFGILVTQMAGEPFASHLPFLLDRNAGPHGTLIGHMARANPQWSAAEGQEVLAIFSGPHVYVSPAWYDAVEVVPTWNYIAVHVYGRLTLLQDLPTLLDIVQSSVQLYEATFPKPWELNAPVDFVEKLLRQIIGFRIEISRIEGKWKLNQNHPVERRQRVIRELKNRDDQNSLAIAFEMERMLPRDQP